MTARYFFDTYALVALYRGDEPYAPYASEPIVCERYNLVELASYLAREIEHPSRIAGALEDLRATLVVPAVEEIAAAGRLHQAKRGERLSYVDAVGYTLACARGLRFLTGDRVFRGMDEVEFVKA